MLLGGGGLGDDEEITKILKLRIEPERGRVHLNGDKGHNGALESEFIQPAGI